MGAQHFVASTRACLMPTVPLLLPAAAVCSHLPTAAARHIPAYALFSMPCFPAYALFSSIPVFQHMPCSAHDF